MIYIEFKKKLWERSMLANMVFEDKIICRSPEQAEETAEKLREPKRYGVRGERYTIENVKVISEREENGMYVDYRNLWIIYTCNSMVCLCKNR